MVEIEIFSDVICPWCFIGKKRLDTVMDSALGQDCRLRWRPYQLYPNLPLDGVSRAELLQRRYGESADAGRVPSRIQEEAQEEGIELRFDLIQRTPNTLFAHRLMEFAEPFGLQHQLAEKLFQGYFCQGADVGDLATLVRLAQQVGLDGQSSRQYLASNAGMEEVAMQLTRAPELGVTGVPGYYLANAFLLPGAQTSTVMGQIITRVRDKLKAS